MSIHFPILRTKRLTIQMKELSMSSSIALAKMPLHAEQATVTAFLNASIEDAGNFADVAAWTVAERNLAICHYLSCVSEGNPNFSVGKGAYMDYLDGENDIKAVDTILEIGELGGDYWNIRHLTGWAAETIERLNGDLPNIAGRLHWIIGAMAAQLVRKDEDCPDQFDEDWLLHRMNVIASLSESDFIELSYLHHLGNEKLHHLFFIDFDDNGVLAHPKERGSELPPARFCVRSCLSGFAQRVGGSTNEFSE